MAVTYYALLTTIGAGKLANATALGTTLKITQLAVGDGGGNVPTPDASRTALVNEVRRAPLNQLSVDPANAAQIIAEQVIPEDVGGWWIREMGLYDEAGALIAYANCAPSYKPQLAEGSGRTQTVRMVLIVSNTASVELKIDPSVVLATREYVDSAIVSAMNKLDQKQSARAATTANITLSGLQTLDGVALAAGDRVLVKNQSNAPDNGIYLVASGAWKRAGDADASAEVTPNLTVAVEEGSTQADSIWQLTTNAPIVLGTTALVFQAFSSGRLLGVRTFTSNSIYTPTPGTKWIIAEGCGGGGSGGAAGATASGQAAAGSGGGAGAYGKGTFVSGFSGANIVIGVGGAAPTMGNGSPGGMTSFGELMSFPGGSSGGAGQPSAGIGVSSSNGGNSPGPVGANIIGMAGRGGDNGLVFSGAASAGAGASCLLGVGGHPPTSYGARGGSGYGAGSSGANGWSGAAQPGMAGQPGVLIIYEYS
ncbi:phage tail protein [Pseudomonas citronellolis]|uniref:phage tail protein n=1 Tax=Pseudomonas citronellolis TaxID=53408 RepID=UPI0021C22675|nr:phage tail protein [Pseudomonas citronellolis]UXJ52102.1 phage tail protein [Pseudomonas citronellolis]